MMIAPWDGVASIRQRHQRANLSNSFSLVFRLSLIHMYTSSKFIGPHASRAVLLDESWPRVPR